MPIKFRCSYCRQFLGISRGRAGEIVDCPTCGRSIRVPGLDGVAAPVPAPELNVRDAKLLRALDELANWNAPQPIPISTATAAEENEVEIPQPIAEPIPIEVPVPPQPIAVKPPPAVELSPATEQEKSAETPMSVAAALAELNQLPAADPARMQSDDGQFVPRRQGRRRSAWVMYSAAIVLILAGFAGGYAVSQRMPPHAGRDEVAEPAAPAAGESAVEPAVSGRITYKTADGSSLPDRGARVLILPREREGTAKLLAAGLRAADHPADVRLATAALRSLGGDLAITDDGGNFSALLPNPGAFQIVVISNYANRNAADDVDPEVLRILTPWFDQPAQVLGRTKVHTGQVRYKGTGTEAWDHSF